MSEVKTEVEFTPKFNHREVENAGKQVIQTA